MATPPDQRRYTDEEVRHLLERASELESENLSPVVHARGPTLEELEGIAVEVGIDPSHLRRAARELDTVGRPRESDPRWTRVLGAGTRSRAERVVGVEASEATLESLLAAIQRRTGDRGDPFLLGGSLTWRSSGSRSNDSTARSKTNVSVSVGGGETRITVHQDFRALASSVFGGTVGGVGCGLGFGVGFGVGFGALGSAAFATLFPPAWLGATYVAARAIYGGMVRRREGFAGELAAELAHLVESAGEPR